MLQTIQSDVIQFILDLRIQNPDEFNPISLTQRVERYSTVGISRVIDQIELVPEKEINQLVQHELIKQKSHSLSFGIKAAQNSGLSYEQIKDLIYRTEGIELSELEVQIALNNPTEIVNQKVNLNDLQIVDNFLNGVIHAYSFTNGKEASYNANPKHFVIAIMIINYFINEIANPISHIANSYTSLTQFYSGRTPDRTKDSQFSKYQILTLDADLQPSTDGPPRIYDSAHNLTIFLCGLEDYTYNYLINLSKSYRFILSLKPSSLYLVQGNFELQRIVEHLEVGHYFAHANLDTSLISKLYDNSYQTLWINVDGQNITFEEFLNDYQIFENTIVTQVLHCEYFKDEKNSTYFISHLDHEFIFYSLDEYEIRQNNPAQKGNARKRIKTFKIDKAEIPINEKSNVLFDILEFKFKNKELVREYFNDVSERG